MSTIHPLKEAISLVGQRNLAKDLGLSHQALRKWKMAGRLPRTEWTGETNYAERIACMTGNKVTREQLLSPWPAVETEPAEEETQQ